MHTFVKSSNWLKVANFLKYYSKTYPYIIGVKELAKGGESRIYRVTHPGREEMVVKCPLFAKNISVDAMMETYDSLMYET